MQRVNSGGGSYGAAQGTYSWVSGNYEVSTEVGVDWVSGAEESPMSAAADWVSGAAEDVGALRPDSKNWVHAETVAEEPTPEVSAEPSAYATAQGAAWDPDQAYDGSWGYTGGTERSVSNEVSGTTEDQLYQEFRENPGEYRYMVPNGDYEVTLLFAEFEVDNAMDRQIRITIEDTVVEDALSIYSEVGKDAALDRTYQVTVSDGELNILFARNGGVKEPVVSAVAVVEGGEGAPPEPTPTPTNTPLPPTPTPTSTNTPLPPTATPTATATPLPPTPTPTPTNTPLPPTPTPTPTNTPLPPTPTPTDTPLPPTPTSTPTPLPPSPTPTPTEQPPSTGCIIESGQFKIGNDRVEWRLFNQGNNTVTIESISVSWPTALGNLKKAKLDGDTFFEEDRTPPSTIIDTFIGEFQKRQIEAGDDRKLKFEFRQKAAIGESDYTITVNFEESCSVQSSVLVAGSVLLGDLNGDCEVNVIDTMLVASAWQSTDPMDIAQYDLDDDDDVDIVDVMLVVGQWGNSCASTAQD